MAISSRFNFVSPGISIQEIDNSQLPAEPINSGPAIIGRLAKGPGLRPVKVSSRSEFVETFGNPVAGGRGGDVWREGNKMGPTYAAYAAFAAYGAESYDFSSAAYWVKRYEELIK